MSVRPGNNYNSSSTTCCNYGQSLAQSSPLQSTPIPLSISNHIRVCAPLPFSIAKVKIGHHAVWAHSTMPSVVNRNWHFALLFGQLVSFATMPSGISIGLSQCKVYWVIALTVFLIAGIIYVPAEGQSITKVKGQRLKITVITRLTREQREVSDVDRQETRVAL